MTIWIFFFKNTLKIRWQFAYIFLMLASGCTNAQIEDRLVGAHTINYYRNSPEDIITLKIPKGYIDYQIVGGLTRKPIESDLYFTAEAISLQPRSKENNESFVYPTALLKQISFSIKSNYAIVLEERHERLQRILGGRFDTLSRPCVRTKVLTLRFDLERHVIDALSCPKVGPESRQDILVERTVDLSIKTMLNCTPDDVPDLDNQTLSGRRPGCAQTYLLPELNALVTVYYPRVYNKDWRELQHRINALLISFIQNKL
jgi:hypothetical protein